MRFYEQWRPRNPESSFADEAALLPSHLSLSDAIGTVVFEICNEHFKLFNAVVIVAEGTHLISSTNREWQLGITAPRRLTVAD